MSKKSTQKSETVKSFSLPYKVTCSNCGAVKAVRHEVLLKRLEKYEGTLQERFEANQAEYLCADCRRAAKQAAIEAEMAAADESATEDESATA